MGARPALGRVLIIALIQANRRLWSGSLQNFLDTPDQVVGMNWLDQEANCPSLDRACPNVLVRISRDKNDGNAMPLGEETVLQVSAVQARHASAGHCITHRLDLN